MSMNLPALLLGGAGNSSGFDLQGFPDVGLLNGAGAGSTKFKLKADDITFNGDVNITINTGGSSGAEGAGKAEGGSDDGDVELAGQLLDMAKDADSPKEKSALLKAAIEVLGGEATKGGEADTCAPGGEGSASGAEGSDEPTSFEGDKLKELLSAEGGTVEKGNGDGFGVENGASGTDRVNGEVDRGQSLTFNVPPENAENGGGSVELGYLFRKGPDGDHVEQAKVVFRDENGKVVDEQIVQGTPDGKATAETDKNFASVEVQPLDNGAGRSRDNSDFTLDKVTLNPASDSGEAAAADKGAEAGEEKELLDMLGQLVNLIETNVEDPEQKSKLLDLVGGLMQSLLGSGAIAPEQAAA